MTYIEDKTAFRFGDPITKEVFALTSQKELDSISEAHVTVMYGGKYSPNKISKYKFDIEQIKICSRFGVLIPLEKDILIKDFQDQNGIPGEESANLLGV